MEPREPELAQVVETRELFEAELIALRLRAAGFETQVIDQSFRQEPLPNIRAFSVVRVMVDATRVEEAQRVLAEAQALPEDAEPAEGPGNDGEGES